MSRALDQSKPYCELHGALGAVYEQDGVLFKGNGMEALSSDISSMVEEIPAAESDEPLPYVFCQEQKSEAVAFEQQVTEQNARNLEEMHWKHLKALVEVYGGIWESKEKAIAFLKGKA